MRQENGSISPHFRTGKLRRIKALIMKEFHQIVRDPSSILICVVLPLLLMFIYGYGVSLDIDHLRIGLGAWKILLPMRKALPIPHGFPLF